MLFCAVLPSAYPLNFSLFLTMQIKSFELARKLKAMEMVQGALFFGPNQGLVRECAELFAAFVLQCDEAQLQEIKQDSMRTIMYGGAELTDNEELFGQEVCQSNLTGEKKLIIVECQEGQDKKIAGIIKKALEDAVNPFVIKAPNLAPASPLRKTFSEHKQLIATGCYEDNQRTLNLVVAERLKKEGKSMSEDALYFLSSHRYENRDEMTALLSSIILYGWDKNKLSYEDVKSCFDIHNLGEGHSFEPLLDAMMLGKKSIVAMELKNLQDEIFFIRSFMRHVMRLLEALALMAHEGRSAKQAMASLRPPVFFKQEASFHEQLRLWQDNALRGLLVDAMRTERALKSRGQMGAIVLKKLCMDCARRAQRV